MSLVLDIRVLAEDALEVIECDDDISRQASNMLSACAAKMREAALKIEDKDHAIARVRLLATELKETSCDMSRCGQANYPGCTCGAERTRQHGIDLLACLEGSEG